MKVSKLNSLNILINCVIAFDRLCLWSAHTGRPRPRCLFSVFRLKVWLGDCLPSPCVTAPLLPLCSEKLQQRLLTHVRVLFSLLNSQLILNLELSVDLLCGKIRNGHELVSLRTL